MKSNAHSILLPDADHRKLIEQGAHADIQLCWTCGSCDFECPVNIATGKLRPQNVVRMANFGMLDELLHEHSVWYCLTCRRCLQICPNAVKPSELIAHTRKMALEKQIVSYEFLHHYTLLFDRFQRVRRQVVSICLQRELDSISDRQWCDWLFDSVPEPQKVISKQKMDRRSDLHRVITAASRADACFTCGECSSACPVSCKRSVFDPRAIFRMVHLGLLQELLLSPSIWLCIDCGRCTDACSQLVDGRQIIRQLKSLSVEQGIVNINFFHRLEQANRLVYRRWIEEVDALFGKRNPETHKKTNGFSHFSACCQDYDLAVSA